MQTQLLITCEHGGCRVPAPYARHFRGRHRVLTSHRGYDPGSLELARRFARQLGVPLVASTVTRLLIELNRSLGHPQLFSEFTRHLDPPAKQRLVERYYTPHRQQVTDWIERQTPHSRVIHLSVHSFTPRLRGETRRADIGLLYDPARPNESAFCRHWQQSLAERNPTLGVRRNYPYLGKADGLTTALRRQFGDAQYLGIELEVNQRWVRRSATSWHRLQGELILTLVEARRQLMSD